MVFSSVCAERCAAAASSRPGHGSRAGSPAAMQRNHCAIPVSFSGFLCSADGAPSHGSTGSGSFPTDAAHIPAEWRLRSRAGSGLCRRVPRRRADNGSAVPSGHTASQRGPAAARVLQQLRPRLSAGRGGHRCVRLRLRRNAALYGSYCRSAAGWFPVPFLWWLRPAAHPWRQACRRPRRAAPGAAFHRSRHRLVFGSAQYLRLCSVFYDRFTPAFPDGPAASARCRSGSGAVSLWHDRTSVHRFFCGASRTIHRRSLHAGRAAHPRHRRPGRLSPRLGRAVGTLSEPAVCIGNRPFLQTIFRALFTVFPCG